MTKHDKIPKIDKKQSPQPKGSNLEDLTSNLKQPKMSQEDSIWPKMTYNDPKWPIMSKEDPSRQKTTKKDKNELND